MTVDANNSNEAFLALYERHVNTVYRVCFTYLRSSADTEDAVQDVFIKLLRVPQAFENVEHEKAWLIRVAANYCKDLLKSGWRSKVALTDMTNEQESASFASADEAQVSNDDILEHVMALPENQRICIYLYYFEGYNAAEIAQTLDKPHSTVRNHLSDARRALKTRLGDEFDG